MTNRIRDIQVISHRLDPHETELRIRVTLEEVTPTTEIRGRLMGPRCVYRSTIEVAYPMREVSRANPIELRVTIPEASWWAPKTPYLYQGPLELWQDGALSERREMCHGIRHLQQTSTGLLLNGRSIVLRGERIGTAFDESPAREWHEDGINTLIAPKSSQEPELLALADRFGFFVMDDEMFESITQTTPTT